MAIVSYIVTALILAGVTFVLYKRRAGEKSSLQVEGTNGLEQLIKVVLKDCTEIIKVDRGLTFKDAEFEASRRNKERIAEALKKCVYGDENSKRTVMEVMRAIIAKHCPDLESCNKIVDFTDLNYLTPEQQFEILIYETSKDWGKDVIKELDKRYHFSKPRVIKEGTKPRCEWDYVLLEQMFKDLVLAKYTSLNYTQALDILTILVFQMSKGPGGKVETLRCLNIDGWELGTIGAIRYRILGTNPDYVIERSCSIQINATWVHLSFINFGTVEEIRRITINMSNVEGSEPLTIKKPLKVVDGYDGSRITCIRPDVGATWGLFVRSFSAGVTRVPDWLKGSGTKNWEMVDRLLYFLAMSSQNIAFTGQQNTGKTTLMKGFIDYYNYVNIRVLEKSFELNLNEIYPERNVFCTKPTEFASSTDVQDLLKKTDGFLSMVGEIAEDIVAANAMRFGLVGSCSTIFSHHGVDYHGLIDGLTGSLISCGAYADYDIAQQIVLDVVKHNVHLNFNGQSRVIEYIEEIEKGAVREDYPTWSKPTTVVEAIHQNTQMNKEFYQRSTDRVRYSSRKIILFDKARNEYIPGAWYSPERFRDMLEKLPVHERDNFIEFYKKYWGSKGEEN